MKKLLLILLSVTMFSCNNNYKEAEELYTQGVNEKSKTLLTSANRKLDMIKENHSDYNKAHLLKTKIDSIKKRWDFNTKLRLKRKNDSIAEIRAIQVKILEDKELKKYPLSGSLFRVKTNMKGTKTTSFKILSSVF